LRIWIRHFVRWDYKNMLNQFSRTELLLPSVAGLIIAGEVIKDLTKRTT